jgi:hypothetical protein
MNGPAFPTDRPSDWRAPPPSAQRAAPGGGFHPFGRDGFSFWDLVDIINPLQHIPMISTLYRRITGDALAPLPRIAGGALFGGIAGVVSAVTNLVVNEATGRDIGDNVFALLGIGIGLKGGDAQGRAEIGIARAPELRESAFSTAPTFSAGWQAAMAMPYADAESLDPRRSYRADAAIADAAGAALAFSAPGAGGEAAARYAEAMKLAAAAGRRLDMRG